MLNDNRHAYIFGDYTTSEILKPQLARYWRVKNGLVWDKGNCSVGDLAGDYGDQWELINYCVKGRRELNGKRDRNILRYPRVSPDKMVHPTQKPIELLGYLIGKSTLEAEYVLDPFMGSGTTAVAAKIHNRQFIGIEISEKYCQIAVERLRQSVMKLEVG